MTIMKEISEIIALDIINRNCLYKNKGWFKKYLSKGYFIKNYANVHNNILGDIDRIEKISNNLEDMIEVLESLHKENWAFYFYSLYSLPQIQILYPEITIRNSNNKSHLIRDLIVTMNLSLDLSKVDGVTIINNIKGLRLTVSREEFITGYQHSHLSTVNFMYNNLLENKLKFCVGTNEVPEVISIFNDNHEKGTFELLLLTISSMMSWESLEGVPYCKIEEISTRAISDLDYVVSSGHIEKIFNLIIDNNILKECDFDMDKYYIRVIKNDNFEKRIIKLVFNNYPDILCINKNNSYYKSKIVSNKIEYKHYTFYFKGQDIEFKVYNNKEQEMDENTLALLQIHPSVLKDVIDKINNYIYEKCVSYYCPRQN